MTGTCSSYHVLVKGNAEVARCVIHRTANGTTCVTYDVMFNGSILPAVEKASSFGWAAVKGSIRVDKAGRDRP